ncbi:hypothetical protein C8R46DRAFT_1273209 [Mycena filopes]|nr:hypothetical protein C8R46DRAFT_1273209 [Mycena filopes]
MPPQTQNGLVDIAACTAVTLKTLDILSKTLDTPFLQVTVNTTQALLEAVQIIKRNKDACTALMERTYELLTAVVGIHLDSEGAGELPPSTLEHIAQFTETLQKIYSFVQAQQGGSKVKWFLRQSEMSLLLKECRAGIERAQEFFQLQAVHFLTTLGDMEAASTRRHQEVLVMLTALGDSATNSDGASSIGGMYPESHASSLSFSMLPSEPKIFHGREAEVTDIIRRFDGASPRIAILGAGGMGKTALARWILHHADISTRYNQHRYFVNCDSATSNLELIALIGSHLGLKPGRDHLQRVIAYFSSAAPSLLVLDNLESAWEMPAARNEVEELLSRLTEINHLALMITMRGAERPGKVLWTRPFLSPLHPLTHAAARAIFFDVADNVHETAEVDKIIALTGNMPLAINLLAHLVDSEGCAHVLARWEEEKTAVVSDGFDKTNNLDSSIALSLKSPRIRALPDAQKLLSLLSILPDGVSDAELQHSELPFLDISGCKTALLRTALAYMDEHKRLKVLVPIREYVHRFQPPAHEHIRPLLKYFTELLKLRIRYSGHLASPQIVNRISSNYFNIQSILLEGLQHGDAESMYSVCNLTRFSLVSGRGTIALFPRVYESLPNLSNHHLQAYIIAERFNSIHYYPISDPESLITEASEHFKHFEDPDLQCRIFNNLGFYYSEQKVDLPEAQKYCERALSLARSSGNDTAQSKSLHRLAWINWYMGDYSTAEGYASKSQSLARLCGDLFREAQALHIEAVCLTELGHYSRSISCCARAKALIVACGMAGSGQAHVSMGSLAEVHKLKSEYMEARNIHKQILLETVENDRFAHTYAVFNLAELDMAMGNFGDDVRESLQKAESVFRVLKDDVAVQWCKVLQADFELGNGRLPIARTLLENGLRFSLGKNTEMTIHCLGRLGNTATWSDSEDMHHWPVVFLAQAGKVKQRLGIYRALQYMGDIFCAGGDIGTAASLFTVALEGFSSMDVHRSKAECMCRLADISVADGDLPNAIELWQEAQALFERSHQRKEVESIQQKISKVE